VCAETNVRHSLRIKPVDCIQFSSMQTPQRPPEMLEIWQSLTTGDDCHVPNICRRLSCQKFRNLKCWELGSFNLKFDAKQALGCYKNS